MRQVARASVVFAMVVLCFASGCKESRCTQEADLLDDEHACVAQKVSFSPTSVQLAIGSSAGLAGTETNESDGGTASDVYTVTLMAGGTEQTDVTLAPTCRTDLTDIRVEPVPNSDPNAPGSCSAVSSVRVRCLTNVHGIAQFQVRAVSSIARTASCNVVAVAPNSSSESTSGTMRVDVRSGHVAPLVLGLSIGEVGFTTGSSVTVPSELKLWCKVGATCETSRELPLQIAQCDTSSVSSSCTPKTVADNISIDLSVQASRGEANALTLSQDRCPGSPQLSQIQLSTITQDRILLCANGGTEAVFGRMTMTTTTGTTVVALTIAPPEVVIGRQYSAAVSADTQVQKIGNVDLVPLHCTSADGGVQLVSENNWQSYIQAEGISLNVPNGSGTRAWPLTAVPFATYPNIPSANVTLETPSTTQNCINDSNEGSP